MAERMDWDEVTYLRKKPQRAADAKSQKGSICRSILVPSGGKPGTKERGSPAYIC